MFSLVDSVEGEDLCCNQDGEGFSRMVELMAGNGTAHRRTRISQDQECSTYVSAAEVDDKKAESNDYIYSSNRSLQTFTPLNSLFDLLSLVDYNPPAMQLSM